MLTRWKTAAGLVGLIVMLGLTVPNIANAHYINTINLWGAKSLHDAEEEYRLALLAKQIIYAKRAGADLSLEVKGAFTDSAVGQLATNKSRWHGMNRLGAHAQEQWLKVSKEFVSTQNWLNGKIDPSYASEFCEVAGSFASILYESLVKAGASADYMKWAFEDIRAACLGATSPEAAIGNVLIRLGSLAKINADNTAAFINALGDVARRSVFVERGLTDTSIASLPQAVPSLKFTSWTRFASSAFLVSISFTKHWSK